MSCRCKNKKNGSILKEWRIRIREHGKTVTLLSAVSKIFVVLFVLAAGWIAVASFLPSAKRGIAVCLYCGAAFSAVSAVRYALNFPRPYEREAILSEREMQKAKKGRSFPSRHTFSAFLIAGMMLSVHLPCACLLFMLAGALAMIRVLLGYHYPRDVIAGAVLGIGFAGLADFLLRLFF